MVTIQPTASHPAHDDGGCEPTSLASPKRESPVAFTITARDHPQLNDKASPTSEADTRRAKPIWAMNGEVTADPR